MMRNGQSSVRSLLVFATAATFFAASNTASLAAMKEVPYPAVKVQLSETYTPDAPFEKMRRAFAEAVAKRDAQALFSLVGPTFVWMVQGAPTDHYDFGRDALHNFKVVFSFREFGSDADSTVVDGSIWDNLAMFAAESTHYVAATNLVCGPATATIADENVFERAKQRIGADDSVEWYFTVADTTATASPGGTGSPVGRISQVALPVLNVHPQTQDGQSGPPVTHLQVLLPSGKPGWIPISAARALVTDRLCYAVTPAGEWKIVAFDQAE